MKEVFRQFPADLVTFTEKILNGKLHFLCSVNSRIIVFTQHFACMILKRFDNFSYKIFYYL